MADNIENLIIEHLKGLRNDIHTLRAEVQAEFRDVKQRLSSLENSVVGIRRDEADTQSGLVRQQVGLDNLVERIQRIERRLELL